MLEVCIVQGFFRDGGDESKRRAGHTILSLPVKPGRR
jgi:hypothetical protein